MFAADMKMDTMNISLPPRMAEFVRRNVERDYGNASEFFRDLLRERMRREIETDVAFLESTCAGAPAGPNAAEIEEILQLQREVRKALRERRS